MVLLLIAVNCLCAGAYNTDAYYQAKDEGFGDVGVAQVCIGGLLEHICTIAVMLEPSGTPQNCCDMNII